VILPLLLLVAVGAGFGTAPLWDFDVWFQLACGRAIVALHGLPARDLFSFTAPDRPWDTQEWAFQVPLYLLHRAAGVGGLAAFKAATLTAALWLAYRRALRAGADAWIAAGACAAGAYTLRWLVVERPQLPSLVFVAGALLALERGGAAPWLLVPLTVAWANVHGGAAPLAPVLAAVWTAGELADPRRRPAARAGLPRRALLLAALGAALCVNPAGARLLAYPIATMADRAYMANVREWTPPTFGEMPSLFVFLAAAAAALAAGWRRRSGGELAVAAACAALALAARRHAGLAVVALLPPLAAAATELAARARLPALARGSAAALLAGLLLAAAARRGEAFRAGVRADLYPAAALAALAADGDGVARGRAVRLFTLHRWGGYAAWRLPARWKVFIDGRQMVYGPALFEAYYRILEDAPGAEGLLARHAPDVFVVEYGTGLGRRLAADPGAALVRWDDRCLVYVRRAAAEPAWLRAREYRVVNPERERLPDAARALPELERAAREAPADAWPWTERAAVLRAAGRAAEGWTAAREAARRAPADPDVLLAASAAALAAGDAAAAGALAGRAARAAPGAPGPGLARARIAAAAGRAAEAARELDGVERRARAPRGGRPAPELAEALELRAALARAAGRDAEAADALRRAGNAWFALDRARAALEDYRRAAALAPGDLRLRNNVASVLVNAGRAAEAVVLYRQVLARAPGDPDVLANLGVAYMKLGRVEEARRAWRAALAARPGHPAAAAFLSESATHPVQ